VLVRDAKGKFRKVKPCGVCGSTDLDFYYAPHDGEPYRTSVQCRCGHTGPSAGGQDERSALLLWNDVTK
jgi:hypothetical protein